VGLDDPGDKVLQAFLPEIRNDCGLAPMFSLLISREQERAIGLGEDPVAMFKDLEREGRKPTLMLRNRMSFRIH
jgi:hypothetical protein